MPLVESPCFALRKPPEGGAFLLKGRLTMKMLFCGLAVLTLTSAPAMAETETPAFLSQHETTAADEMAIRAILTAYTTAVSTGNQAAFEALLLNDRIPFSSTSSAVGPKADPKTVETRRYSEFRKAIFESGVRYSQQFYNVHIQQDGPLAQASLDFVTREAENGRGGYGFKTLQLLKVAGQWKIASEFYTGRPLPGGS